MLIRVKDGTNAGRKAVRDALSRDAWTHVCDGWLSGGKRERSLAGCYLRCPMCGGKRP